MPIMDSGLTSPVGQEGNCNEGLGNSKNGSIDMVLSTRITPSKMYLYTTAIKSSPRKYIHIVEDEETVEFDNDGEKGEEAAIVNRPSWNSSAR